MPQPQLVSLGKAVCRGRGGQREDSGVIEGMRARDRAIHAFQHDGVLLECAFGYAVAVLVGADCVPEHPIARAETVTGWPALTTSPATSDPAAPGSSASSSRYPAVLYPGVDLGQVFFGCTAKWGSGGRTGPGA